MNTFNKLTDVSKAFVSKNA